LNPIAETEFNHLTITEICENTIPQAERFGGVGAGVLTIWLSVAVVYEALRNAV
jgi:hypothetical protein